MKVKWLNRTMLLGPYLAVCTSEKEFRAALKHVKCRDNPPFISNEQSHATCHFMRKDCGDLICILAVKGAEEQSPAVVAALMAHEAVHIWKTLLDDIGEANPGEEIEAYGIQALTLALTDEILSRR